MQMLQKLVLIKHLKEQMEEGDKSEVFRTHLRQLPLSVERHQDEDVGHCQHSRHNTGQHITTELRLLSTALPPSTD